MSCVSEEVHSLKIVVPLVWGEDDGSITSSIDEDPTQTLWVYILLILTIDYFNA